MRKELIFREEQTRRDNTALSVKLKHSTIQAEQLGVLMLSQDAWAQLSKVLQSMETLSHLRGDLSRIILAVEEYTDEGICPHCEEDELDEHQEGCPFSDLASLKSLAAQLLTWPNITLM